MASEKTEAACAAGAVQAEKKISRRELLKGSAAAAVVVGLAASLPGGALAGTVRSAAPVMGAAYVPADSAVVASLLAHIKYGDAAARTEAVRTAPLVGTDLLPALGRVSTGSDPAAARAATEAMRRVVHNAGRPGAETETRAAAAHLAQIASAPYPRMARAEALDLLGVVAAEAEVPALAALLSDRELGEDARMALERIPGKSADEALKAAARGATKEQRDAINLSLRHRRLKRNDLGVRR